MKKNQNTDILKEFRSGNFSEALDLWTNELKNNALKETVHQCLVQAKEHLEEISEDNTSEEVLIKKISALQSFYQITLSGKFRESSGEKSAESPVSGIKETADGDIVISDDFNHQIQIYDKDYQLKLSFGQKGKNPGEFYYPKGIDIDKEGNIYVADCWNHRIQKFTKEGKFISTFGSYGNEPSQFHEPVSIAVNNNRLLVVDRCNHRIQFFDENGNYRGHIGHRGRTIEENLAELFETPFDKFSFPSFEFPSDIALDGKNDIYIVDSHNHRILKLASNGYFKLSFGRQGKENGEFLYPQSIAIDRFDNIFISDLNNNRIQVFSPVGEHFFSFSRNGVEDNIDSPTVLACGRDSSLYAGFAFNPMVLTFNYSQISQKERHRIKKELNKNSADSLYFSGNFFNREQSWTKAIENYEKTFSIIAANDNKIIPKLPLNYLHAARQIQKEDISPHLSSYYEKELCRLNSSVLEIYQNRKNVTEKLIDPILKDEVNIIEEKLTSGEIDKNLYELNKLERDLFRKTREISLELKRTTAYQTESLLQLTSIQLLKQDNNEIKTLIQKSLSNFYLHLDSLNRFLDDHDKQNLKCFELIKDGAKGSFNLREFRLAYELTEVAEDFIKLIFPILKSSVHLLSQLALKISASKSDSAIDLFSSLTEDKNIRKMGSALLKLRYDFEAILQLKECLRVLFSYLRLNSDELISSILINRYFDKSSLLDKDKFNFEKDLIELLFIEEMGINKKENGLRVGLYYFNDSDLNSFQSQTSPDDEEKYTDLLNNLQKALDQLFSERKELDKLILKHETNLKSIHPGDQKSRLQIINEYNLVKTQSTFGNKLILEHLFLFRIINFKRCLCLFVNSELKRMAKDETGVKEIYQKIDALCDEFVEISNRQKSDIKKTRDTLVLWENNSINLIKSPSEIDMAKEIDTSKNLFQLYKDLLLLELLKNEYASLANLQEETKRYLTQKKQPKTKIDSLKFYRDLQFGSLGNNSGQLNMPAYMCSNLNNDIFVTEKLNNRIQKFDSSGNHLLTFGSFGDSHGFFYQPFGITCDQNNNLFVCDRLNHRIQKFDSDGNHLLSWGMFGDKEENFNSPIGICAGPEGYIYVADTLNHRIQKFTSDGKFVLSFGKHGEKDGEFLFPVAISFYNNMIVAGENRTDKIRFFDQNGSFIKSFNYSKGTASHLQGTSNICSNEKGHLFICEFWNNNIYVITEDFSLITATYLPDNLKFLFNNPAGIAFNDKYMFICDFFNHRIHRFSQ